MSTTLSVQGSPDPDWYEALSARIARWQQVAKDALLQARADWKRRRHGLSGDAPENDNANKAA